MLGNLHSCSSLAGTCLLCYESGWIREAKVLYAGVFVARCCTRKSLFVVRSCQHQGPTPPTRQPPGCKSFRVAAGTSQHILGLYHYAGVCRVRWGGIDSNHFLGTLGDRALVHKGCRPCPDIRYQVGQVVVETAQESILSMKSLDGVWLLIFSANSPPLKDRWSRLPLGTRRVSKDDSGEVIYADSLFKLTPAVFVAYG